MSVPVGPSKKVELLMQEGLLLADLGWLCAALQGQREGELALQVAQLSAQAAAAAQELYRQQDNLLQTKQVSSGKRGAQPGEAALAPSLACFDTGH